MKIIKKKMSLALAALMCFNLCYGVNVMGNDNDNVNVKYYGDIDGNGVVEINDLTKFSMYLLGDYNMPDKVIPIMDFNTNGMADLADMASLKQYIMKEDIYPIGEVYVTEQPPVTTTPPTEVTTGTTTQITLPPVTTQTTPQTTEITTPDTTVETTIQTTQKPQNTVYYACDADVYNGITETINPGFTGQSYVNYNNEMGSSVTWNVNVPSDGYYKMTVRYANGTEVNRPLGIFVNNNNGFSTMNFAGTSAWTEWKENDIFISLNSGSNMIKAEAITQNGGPNVDYIKLEVTGQQPAETQPPVTVPPAKDYPSDPQGNKQERQVEYLDRGLIATKTGSGMLVSWRLLGTDRESTSFKLYKDGTLIYTADQNKATTYLDKSGNTGSKYTLLTYQGTEKTESSDLAAVLGNGYMDIPMEKPGNDYTASDCSVGDVDGDGQYEIFVKWDPADAKDNAQDGVTGNVFIDCYTLQGKKLWRINLGRNIRAGAHYTQYMVYDFDGDGKSEMICKTADGTVDGTGKSISKDSKSYVNESGYILDGNEYLTVFNGQTGAEMSTISYNPPRGTVSSWGDKYGNRCDRFLAGVAYFDGKTPSVVMCRGYYTRAVLVAYDWDGSSLEQRWIFDSTDGGTDSKGNPNSDYSGQGTHNLSVADVDNDGFDEIIYGSCCIDHNGKGLYSTKLNHGDALHVGDFIPDRPGLEVWQCHETSPYGCTLRDAATGNIIFRYTADKDTGRCAAANILAGNNTAEFWGSRGAGVYDGAGNVVGSQNGVAQNFLIYWDGDLESELLDGTTICKYNGNGVDTLLSDSGVAACNGTKNTPNLSADIFGDWREELIVHTTDSSALRIYSTTYTTDLRMFTLMHDTQYRTAIAWQNTAYNQPPHASFFLGTGFKLPSFPFVYQANK